MSQEIQDIESRMILDAVLSSAGDSVISKFIVRIQFFVLCSSQEGPSQFGERKTLSVTYIIYGLSLLSTPIPSRWTIPLIYCCILLFGRIITTNCNE
jgi:hypothetical protein